MPSSGTGVLVCARTTNHLCHLRERPWHSLTTTDSPICMKLLITPALLLPLSAFAAQSPRVPSAVVDLRTTAGTSSVSATWRFANADIINSTNNGPDANNKPTGPEQPAHTLAPNLSQVSDIDARSDTIQPTSLEQRRTSGKLAFAWYTLDFVVPEKIGGTDVSGATLVFEATVDDYAEVSVDNHLDPVLGSSRGPLITGWNSPTRVLITRDAIPGTHHTIRILAANGPFSNPPSNFIWLRSATLDVYAGERERDATEVETTITRIDPVLDAIIDPHTKIEKLADGFGFGEGPVWVPQQQEPAFYGGGGTGGYLLFSDPNQNVIHRFDPDADVQGVTTIYRTKSGYTGTDIGKYHQPGSNGLALDAQGRLTICEHGNRRVTRLERNGAITILADNFEGKRLNSPNDLVYRSDGTLYFTDPPFGLPEVFSDPAKEIAFSGVFMLTSDGTLKVAAKDLAAPNGLAFSPDEKYMYVDNWETNRKVILRYDVAMDGTLSNPTTFFDMTSTPGDICLDGLKVDPRGNLFVSGPGGVWIISSQGKHLGTITGPELPANFAFGGADRKMLYITARSGLYRIRVR
ncbi:MAG: SMP-30/gluconolactonase/LRE family protein [Phycisphaerales bacterium]